ncbi:hypothetical protein BC826DRAFT_968759 [Russula brevipes]|nr:hypothetical protein BC826DRAFT_968759 [Russula brevipes]
MATNYTPRTAIEEGDQQNGAHFLQKKFLSSRGMTQQGYLYMRLVQYLLHDQPSNTNTAVAPLQYYRVVESLLELHSSFGFGKFLKAVEFKEDAKDTYYTVKEFCGREADDDDTIIKETARAAAGTADANGNLVSSPNTAARANSEVHITVNLLSDGAHWHEVFIVFVDRPGG